MNTCAAADLARQNTIYVPGVLQRMLARSFGFGPTQVQPTGLAGIIAGDVDQRLAPSEFVIAPTADVSAVAAPATSWNAWVDGRYLYTDYTDDAGDLDGPTFTGLAGIDYKITSKVSLGLAGLRRKLRFRRPADRSREQHDRRRPLCRRRPDRQHRLLGQSSGQPGRFGAGWRACCSSIPTGSRPLQPSTVTGTRAPGASHRALTFAWSKDWEEESSGLFADRTIETGVLTPVLPVRQHHYPVRQGDGGALGRCCLRLDA